MIVIYDHQIFIVQATGIRSGLVWASSNGSPRSYPLNRQCYKAFFAIQVTTNKAFTIEHYQPSLIFVGKVMGLPPGLGTIRYSTCSTTQKCLTQLKMVTSDERFSLFCQTKKVL